MSDKRYLGNIITQNPTAPAGNLGNSAAKGVWSLEEQLAYQKAGLWPIPGNSLNVEDMFSTYLNNDGSSDQTITNGIDLAGEGGLVWGKLRNSADGFFLVDSARGKGSNNNFKYLRSDTTSQELDIASRSLSSMNSNGFTFQGADAQFNAPGNEYVYWTFRKAEKFFTCLTYTGDGNASKTLSHDLGTAVGCIIVKRTDSTADWLVYHRSLTYANGTGGYLTTNAGQNALRLNKTNNVNDSATYWNNTDATSTNFTVGSEINVSNASYVAYLFAHNDGDGEFGPDFDQDAIKCSHYVGDGTNDFSKEINVGFEPQFVIVKKTSQTTDTTGWGIADAMRGFNTGNTNWLITNTSAAESTLGGEYIELTSTGFKVGTTTWNSNTAGYIYIAIRRPTAVPTSATEVFAPNFYGTNGYVGYLGAPADMHMLGYRSGNSQNAITSSRLIQGNKALVTSSRSAEITSSSSWDNMSGVTPVGTTLTTLISWTWKRASGFMDCVAYSGDGTTARAIPHNLGVPPQLMIHKRRNSTNDWYVPDFINSKLLFLNDPAAANNTAILANYYGSGNGSSGGAGSLVTPDASTFTVTPNINVNASGGTYIVYLFATLAGISKVGSATHSGTTNVDCGFTSGARFVLLKRTDASGDWYIWDSTRGIVSGNDPYLLLNSTAAEVTNTDLIDPLSSGFTITSNFTAGDYIFYAIA